MRRLALILFALCFAAPSFGQTAKVISSCGSITYDAGQPKDLTQDTAGKLCVNNVGASGDVVGPASATDNAIVRFDGTTGKLLQNSLATVSDQGYISTPGTVIDAGNFFGPTLRNDGAYGWTSTTNPLGTTDLALFRDAANTLAQRNGTNAQAFRVYNTYTDASNYERAVFDWTTVAGSLSIGAGQAGTGVARGVYFLSGGSARWQLTSAGHLLANADNTYDIGASGATRPRDYFGGRNITIGGDFQLGSGNFLGWTSRSLVTSPSDGVIRLTNNAASDFSRLQFGGTTSSFPSLKRSGTGLIARLADDSADAPLTASALTLSATPLPVASGGTATTTTGVVEVKKNANQTAADYTAGAVVAWDTDVTDTNNFHDTVTNNSRLTSVAGYTYADVGCNVLMASQTLTDAVTLEILESGAVLARQISTAATASPAIAIQVIGRVINTPGTTYYECKLTTSVDNSITITTSSRFSLHGYN